MFKHIIWITAMFIAACAALFSVTGIATLYAGAMIPVAVMAASLEAGKLVSASYLYRYWLLTPKALKGYLVTGVTVLMIVTSLGIYAFLTASYAKVAAVPARILSEIEVIDARQISLNSNIERYQNELGSLDQRLTQAQQAELDERQAAQIFGRSTQTTTRLRTEISEQASSTRALLESAVAERDSLEMVKVDKRSEVTSNSKIGTFVYIAEAFGVPLDQVVKWFTLIIVFVFDPLAVTLVLAYNIIVVAEKGRPHWRKEHDLAEWPMYEKSNPPQEEQEFIEIKHEEPAQEEPIEDDGEYQSSRISVLKALKEALKKPEPVVDNTPYYVKDDYDWDTDDRWKTDEQAIRYKHKSQRVPS